MGTTQPKDGGMCIVLRIPHFYIYVFEILNVFFFVGCEHNWCAKVYLEWLLYICHQAQELLRFAHKNLRINAEHYGLGYHYINIVKGKNNQETIHQINVAGS